MTWKGPQAIAAQRRDIRCAQDFLTGCHGCRRKPVRSAIAAKSVLDVKISPFCGLFGINGRRTETRLPCFYEKVWEDGFGARGWKLGSGVADPEIIASTAATGARIPTSVFGHDILDHALCGLGTSGHRNEAVALIQLASRTGTDPTADFAQMVDEDLLQGRVLGEELTSFRLTRALLRVMAEPTMTRR